MTTLVAPEQPGSTIRRIKICIGDEWVEINFGRALPREQAMQRARVTLESLA